jgi:hypothetical protein
MYVYMRQIDLSLDRVRWESWKDIQAYYKSKISPIELMEFIAGLIPPLSHNTSLDSLIADLPETTEQNLVSKFLSNQNYLTEKELAYEYQLLFKFNYFLGIDFEKFTEDHEKLRVCIARFYSSILEPKLKRKDVEQGTKIEHFNQSDSISTIEIREFQ